jgi:hypothetical protein
MKRHLGALALLLAALAAIVLFKTVGQPAAARGQFKDDPPPTAAYEQACNSDPASARCALLHGAMRSRALEALEIAEAARDQRLVDAVLGYFDLQDEPQLHQAAGRIVELFPSQAAATRVRPLLWSDHPISQRTAARLLEQSTDPTDRHLARQWQKNHEGSARDQSPYARQPAQPDAAQVKLQRYPGALRWAPADAATSIGLATTDPLPKVVDFYARALGATAFGPDELERRRNAAMTAQGKATQAEVPDMRQDPDLLALEKLAREYQRTKDPALLRKLAAAGQRMEERGKQMRKRVEDAENRTHAGLLQSFELPGGRDESPRRTARFVVAEQRGARVVRMVAAYREETLGKTVVQLLWDPVAYPVFMKP